MSSLCPVLGRESHNGLQTHLHLPSQGSLDQAVQTPGPGLSHMGSSAHPGRAQDSPQPLPPATGNRGPGQPPEQSSGCRWLQSPQTSPSPSPGLLGHAQKGPSRSGLEMPGLAPATQPSPKHFKKNTQQQHLILGAPAKLKMQTKNTVRLLAVTGLSSCPVSSFPGYRAERSPGTWRRLCQPLPDGWRLRAWQRLACPRALRPTAGGSWSRPGRQRSPLWGLFLASPRATLGSF